MWISILCSAIVLVLTTVWTYMTRKVSKTLGDFKKEHSVLLRSQRHQIKATIVHMYENAMNRGYITPMELDTMNRLYESYEALEGNTYIKAIVHRANVDLELRGEAIPDEVH